MAASTSVPRQLHLNAFLMTVGHHESAWRFPESSLLGAWDLQHYAHLAREAERGLFDSIFFGDGPALQGDVRYRPVGRLDPTVLLPALAAVTERIGLVATASTTYNEPYNLARRFASIDHISGGRAGWNIVTTAGSDAAQNFGLDEVPAHRVRYERATEFVEVCLELWDSWDSSSACAARSTCRPCRRAIRCWFRRAPRKTVASLLPATRRRYSRRSRRSPMDKPSIWT
jgi:alkanesulfonate monooxygenase SsuD/methylene tetrahydromethanopterin reductase-like flavin-dependent oxidoreductase (luciferase family)